MAETVIPQETTSKTPVVLIAVTVLLAILLAVALFLVVDLRGRVTELEKGSVLQNGETKVIMEKLKITDRNMEAGMEALGSKVGMTQEDIARRTAELRAQYQAWCKADYPTRSTLENSIEKLQVEYARYAHERYPQPMCAP